MKKFISLLLTLCLAFTMSISIVNADEVTSYGLTLVDNTVTPAKTYEFTGEDLDKLATTKNHNFSGINNQGTVKIEKNIYGVNLKTLLKKAGFTTSKKLKKIKSIEFDASGDKLAINTSDLFSTRYYYSKLQKFNAVKGKVNTKSAKKNRKAVSPIIALNGPDDQNAKLYLGQEYASERNWPKFWGNITTIILNKTSTEVTRYEAAKITIEKEVKKGTSIAFDEMNSLGKPIGGFIYYTMNGKNPSEENAYIYNYDTKQGRINAKVFSKTGNYTVKAVIRGFGKKDSKVKTFKTKVTK